MFESIYDPQLQLDPTVWNLFNHYGLPAPESTFDMLRPEFFHRLCRVFQNPKIDVLELEAIYGQLDTGLSILKEELSDDTMISITENEERDYRLALIELQAGYGLLLAFAIMINLSLQTIYLSSCSFAHSDPSKIRRECVTYVNEVIMLGEAAKVQRPLGSSYVPICLGPAWLAASDSATKTALQDLFEVYRDDFLEYDWQQICLWLKQKLEGLSQQCIAVNDQAVEDSSGDVDIVLSASGVVYALESKAKHERAIAAIKWKCIVM